MCVCVLLFLCVSVWVCVGTVGHRGLDGKLISIWSHPTHLWWATLCVRAHSDSAGSINSYHIRVIFIGVDVKKKPVSQVIIIIIIIIRFTSLWWGVAYGYIVIIQTDRSMAFSFSSISACCVFLYIYIYVYFFIFKVYLVAVPLLATGWKLATGWLLRCISFVSAKHGWCVCGLVCVCEWVWYMCVT